MQKQPLTRRAPMRTAYTPTEAKPAPGPKPKSCRVCRTKFIPASPLAAVCGVPCAIEHGKAITAKQKAKARSAERAADKAKREKLKTRGDHIAEVQTVFNALVRFRDRDEVCISCDTVLSTLDGAPGGGYDAGHYRSRGSAPHLRFDLRNCHGQCKKCNRYRAGNAADYRIGLIVRIGLAAVEALEAEQGGGGWTIAELIAMKAEFKAQLKKMKEAA